MTSAAERLTACEQWDWDKARGAECRYGDDNDGDSTLVGSAATDGVWMFYAGRLTRGDASMLTLDLASPSTHGVLLSMLHHAGSSPRGRELDEGAEEYGTRLAELLIMVWT